MAKDPRKYARQTHRRLVLGALSLLFLVGGGLIYIFYGREAALSGLLCLGLGLSPLVLIWLALWVIDIAVSKANQ